MTTMLAGKLAYSVLLASHNCSDVLWAWASLQAGFFSIFGLRCDGLSTAFAVGAFGMLRQVSAAPVRNWDRSQPW